MILLIFKFSYTYSQSIIEQGFDNGINISEDWTIKVGGTYTSSSNCGKNIPSIKFSASNQYIITPYFNDATDLSFWIKGNSVDSSSYMIISWSDSITWYILDTLCPIHNNATTINYTLPSHNVRQLKFEYFKSAGNVAFDDLMISKPTPPVYLSDDKIQIVQIKDFSTSIKFYALGSGLLIYVLLPDSIEPPTLTDMLTISAYKFKSSIVDSGYIVVNNSEPISWTFNNLQPEASYNLYLLPTGSKKNVSDSSRIITLPFKTSSRLPDLFFATIIKGIGNNKAIEIVNPSSDTIFLSNYRIAQSTNGGGWTTSYFNFKPNQKIMPYSSFLIMKNTADSNLIQLYKPDTLTSSKILAFTGNDARALQRTTNHGKSWFTIDVYGLPNQSSNFSVAGINNAAANYNLIRKLAIKKGNIDWTLSAAVDSISSEWLLKALNDYSMIRLKRLFSKQIQFNYIWFELQIEPPIMDTLQRCIYIKLNKSANFQQIKWSCTVNNNIKVIPDPDELADFSISQKIYLIDSLSNDTTIWQLFFILDVNDINDHSNQTYNEYKNASLINIYTMNHSLIIENYSNQKIHKILLYNILGQNIFDVSQSTNRINIENLKNGVYLVKIYLSNNQLITYKKVKME